MRTSLIVAVAAAAFAAAASAAPFEAPFVLRAEHEDLGADLRYAAAAPGEVGAAARAAADLVAPHLAAEERIVLPLLGLAAAAAQGTPVADAPGALAGVDRLRAELPRLAEEEIAIVGALTDLFAAAEAAGRPDISDLADRMIRHAIGDVEIAYPAALLVGERLEARLGAAGPVRPAGGF